MCAIFNLITMFCELVLRPFSALAPIWGVSFLALLTAFFALLVYKKVSNQDAIKLLKKRIQGYFLGIYLFRDNIAQIFISLGRLLSNVFRYMGHAVLPLAVMIVPIVLLCVQMQVRYGYFVPAPGESVVVTARLEPGANISVMDIGLRVSKGLESVTPALRLAGRGEIEWKIRLTGEGDRFLDITAAGRGSVAKVGVGRTGQRLYWAVTKASPLNCFLYPGESPLEPGSPVREVRIGYPQARVNMAGLRVHWSIAYFVIAIVFGLLLKPFLKVEF